MRNLNKYLLRERPQPIDLNDAKAAWAAYRGEHGAKAVASPLLTAPEANYKFAKTPVPVYGLSLAPDKSSLTWAVCDNSTPECRKGCVAFAGQGEAPNVTEGRTRKTEFLAHSPNAFVTLLHHEIQRAMEKHHPQVIGVRLNAFSDLEWERIVPWMFTSNPRAEFYDYTKRPFGSRTPPANYHLTYSVSERTIPDEMSAVLDAGQNLAMVVNVKKGEPMPEYVNIDSGHQDGNGNFGWRVYPLIDGDASDARYLDASWGHEGGVVIGLRPKGRMRKFPVGPTHMIREVN